MKVKEVTDLIQKSVKHLTFSPIPNVSEFNIKNIYGNITSIRSLCNHALLLDSFTPSSFTDFYYAEHGEGTYELWLIWNMEFCVTKLSTNNSSGVSREVIDYGKCAFALNNRNFLWNFAQVEENLEKNLMTTFEKTQLIYNSLQKQIEKISV